MTQRANTHELVEALVGDLRPVEPFPSLRTAVFRVLRAWGIAAIVAALLYGPGRDWFFRLFADPAFTGVMLALALGAAAASLAAITGAVPGLEATEARARLSGWLGLALALAVGVLGWAVYGPGAPPAPDKDVTCFVMSLFVGAAPAVVLTRLAVRGLLRDTRRSAALVLLGAFAAGALVIHLICRAPGARHALVAHVLVPVVMLALAAWPLSRWLRRRAARTSPTI